MDDGGPAFPGTTYKGGMKLRDYFATAAMSAVVAHQQNGTIEMTSRDELASCAYEIADAMLAARQRPEGSERP